MHNMGFCICPECPQNRNRQNDMTQRRPPQAVHRLRRREAFCGCEWCDLWERFEPDIVSCAWRCEVLLVLILIGLLTISLQELGDIAQAYDLVHRFFRGASIPAIRVQRTIRDIARDIVAFTRLSEYVIDPRVQSFVARLNEIRDDVRFENLAMRRKALRGVERRDCVLGW